MACLVDTCILLRAFDRGKAEQPAIVTTLRRLWSEGETLFVSVQNVAEFWNVPTRPNARNGLGESVASTARRVRLIERFSTICSESLASYTCLKRLLSEQGVLGVQVHDARLVSVMLAEGIGTILTHNGSDFRRFPIGVLSPDSAEAE